MRASSLVGLRYLGQKIAKGAIPSPHAIYLDSAHEYPETVIEIQAAWALLQPGGERTCHRRAFRAVHAIHSIPSPAHLASPPRFPSRLFDGR